MRTPDIELLHKAIHLYCEKNQIMGIIRVTVRDEIMYEGTMGYASVEEKRSFDRRSLFSLYSLSKPFCVLGLLRLYERGVVDLSAHPSEYVPECAGFDSRVNIRHMLHHISGLPDFEFEVDLAKALGTGYAHQIREQLPRLAQQPQYFEPGTEGRYANINMIIPALIIENVSGMSYAEYMKREVFEPLSMPYALVDNETLTLPARVSGYDLQDGKLVPVGKSDDWLLGAGDIVATVDDVYALNRIIKTKTFLSLQTWNEVLTPSPHNGMGMGCTISCWHGKERITHNGGHTGFRTLHIQLPEDDFDIIILSNCGFGDARHDISEMIYAAFYGADDEGGERVQMDVGYI